jgi:hypothetical protein
MLRYAGKRRSEWVRTTVPSWEGSCKVDGVRIPIEVKSLQVAIAGNKPWELIAVTRGWPTIAVDDRWAGESVLVISLMLWLVLGDVVETCEELAEEDDGEPGGIKPVSVSLVVSDVELVELMVETTEACRL